MMNILSQQWMGMWLHKREIWYEQDYMKAEFHDKNDTIYSALNNYKYYI